MDDKIKKILDDYEVRISKLEKAIGNKNNVKIKKSTSVASLIEALKDEGFFNQPRMLKEIRDELAKNNYHYSVTSLTNPLQRLTRQKILGRLLENGKWAYVKR